MVPPRQQLQGPTLMAQLSRSSCAGKLTRRCWAQNNWGDVYYRNWCLQGMRRKGLERELRKAVRNNWGMPQRSGFPNYRRREVVPEAADRANPLAETIWANVPVGLWSPKIRSSEVVQKAAETGEYQRSIPFGHTVQEWQRRCERSVGGTKVVSKGSRPGSRRCKKGVAQNGSNHR